MVLAMDFSIWPAPGRSWDDITSTARVVDDSGWHGIWFADHYMPNTEDGDVSDGDTHECWAILPALAATTTNVRLGSLVSPTSVHHPALLANRISTIDHISNGRAVLGLGAGWQVNEHRAYGIELQEPGERVGRFDESIQIVRSLLGEQRTTFDGRYYTISDAPCAPKPIQSRLPLLVGTGGSRMMRITARHADEWNTWGDVETAATRSTSFLTACEAVGRDPTTIRRSVQAIVFLEDDAGTLAQLRENAPAGRSIVGTPSELVDTIREYAELGFDEFIVPEWNFGRDLDQRLAKIERFRTEVASHFD
jgi:alkanesulfonate monooxygenase SsuD/methylene tetrahydromethanopterin reductase-like flavin-dependent oxidoreductase (luciferase family)